MRYIAGFFIAAGVILVLLLLFLMFKFLRVCTKVYLDMHRATK